MDASAPISPQRPVDASPSSRRKMPPWIIVLIVASLALILTTLLLYFALFNRPSRQSSSSTPSPTPVNQEKDENAGDDPFSTVPTSMLYYSFDQTSGAKHVFRADPTDTKRQQLSVGFPGTFTFATSPDGLWLIRYRESSAEVASVNNLQQFSTIPLIIKPPGVITSIGFSYDSQYAVIASHRPGGNGISASNQIYIQHLKDLSEASITVFQEAGDSEYAVLGASADVIVAASTSRGQTDAIYRIEIKNGKRQRLGSLAKHQAMIGQVSFAKTAPTAYLAMGSQIYQFDLVNDSERLALTTNAYCAGQGAAASQIIGFTASPDGKSALANVECVTQGKGDRSPTIARSLVLFDMQSGGILKSDRAPAFPEYTWASWSADGRSVWLTIDTETTYIVSLPELTARRIPSLDRRTVTKEKLFLLGWLGHKNS